MLDSLTDKQRKIVIIIGIVVVIIVMIFIYQKTDSKQILEQDDSSMMVQNSEKSVQSNDNITRDNKEEGQIVVHVAGEVKSPGIVKLNEGERIEDAIEKAGGLTDNAQINNVNLAYVLEDGVKIIIPSKDSIEEDKIINEDAGKGIIIENSYEENKIMININKATESDFERLSGVGASLATKIIDYRNKNGKFSTIEDIKNVSGIGESKFNAIKDYICVK